MYDEGIEALHNFDDDFHQSGQVLIGTILTVSDFSSVEFDGPTVALYMPIH
jgi:hypothetical protein